MKISTVLIKRQDGNHTVHLNLYDGGVLIGRSVPEQESVVVVAGQPIHLDLVPLHGEATFNFNVGDGNASFTVNIPSDIVDEVGGVANLFSVLRLSNEGNLSAETSLDFMPNGSLFTSNATLDGLQFGTYAMDITFSDSSETPHELVGSCTVSPFILDANGSTVNCQVELRRRGVIGGNILAVLGVNVYDTDMKPVVGSGIYADGKLLGITGSGTFGTPGYVKLLMHEGNYSLRAQNEWWYGDENVTLAPLDVKNIDFILDTLDCVPVDTVKDAYFSDEAKEVGRARLPNGNCLVWDGRYWRLNSITGAIQRYRDYRAPSNYTYLKFNPAQGTCPTDYQKVITTDRITEDGVPSYETYCTPISNPGSMFEPDARLLVSPYCLGSDTLFNWWRTSDPTKTTVAHSCGYQATKQTCPTGWSLSGSQCTALLPF